MTPNHQPTITANLVIEQDLLLDFQVGGEPVVSLSKLAIDPNDQVFWVLTDKGEIDFFTLEFLTFPVPHWREVKETIVSELTARTGIKIEHSGFGRIVFTVNADTVTMTIGQVIVGWFTISEQGKFTFRGSVRNKELTTSPVLGQWGDIITQSAKDAYNAAAILNQ